MVVVARETGCRLRTARLRVYVVYFPAHCVGVTNMSPHYILSPRCEDILPTLAAPATQTTDLWPVMLTL